MKSQNALSKIGWIVMLLLSALMFWVASRYLSFDPEVFFPEQRTVYMAHRFMLYMHIIGSMFATIIGPFQFVEGIRKGRWLPVHRWIGRIYLLGILSGGLGGLYMAQVAYGGIVARLGFTSVAILWLISGWLAYRHIRNKDVELHREWMIRNYALTFAAVTLRLWQTIFAVTGVDFLTGYIIVAWLCWIPNLFIAQWMIAGRKNPKNQGIDSKLLRA